MTESQRKSLTEIYSKNRDDKKPVVLKFEIDNYYHNFFEESYPMKRQKQKFKKINDYGR